MQRQSYRKWSRVLHDALLVPHNPRGLKSVYMPLEVILHCAEDAHSLPCAHMIGLLLVNTVNSAEYSDAAGIF